MLGAQARAAELQAAKSAAMRQRAHCEIEELAVPPESAAVLLTDFVRNPLLNKNKGTKTFRPLIESDFEAPMNQTDRETSGPVTPSGEDMQLNLLETAPVAPRAMLTRSDSHSSRMTPSRVRAPTFTPQGKTANLLVKPSNGYTGLVSTQPYRGATQNIVGYVFGPDDLSPAKQEIKFDDIREQYENIPVGRTPIQHFQAPFILDARMYTPQHNYSYQAHLQYLDTSVQASYDPYMRSHPGVQQYQSEADTSATGYSSVQAHAERTHLFAEDLMDHQLRLQQYPRGRDAMQTQTSIIENDQPYDRHSKMQSFVAAQQAMARKGKTVLHNPDLRKSPHRVDASTHQSFKSPAAVVSQFQVDANTSDSIMEKTVKMTDSIGTAEDQGTDGVCQAVLEGDVFEADAMLGSAILNGYKPTDIQTTETYGDNSLPALPAEVMTEDWCTLRPITNGERQRLLYSTRRKAIPHPKDICYPFNGDPMLFVGSLAREWFLRDCTHQSARRTATIEIVERYEKGKYQSSVYGIIGKPLSKEKSDLGSRGGLKAVANIMATLYDCLDDFTKHPELSPYTTPMECAIDRCPGSNLSLFDNLGFEVQKKVTDIVH